MASDAEVADAAADAGSKEDPSEWECVADSLGVAIRSTPDHMADPTGEGIKTGERFLVSETKPGADGALFLKLADGRGWVFETMPGLPQGDVVCRKVQAQEEAAGEAPSAAAAEAPAEAPADASETAAPQEAAEPADAASEVDLTSPAVEEAAASESAAPAPGVEEDPSAAAAAEAGSKLSRQAADAEDSAEPAAAPAAEDAVRADEVDLSARTAAAEEAPAAEAGAEESPQAATDEAPAAAETAAEAESAGKGRSNCSSKASERRPKLKNGQSVEAVGLEGYPEYNGRIGRIVSHDPSGELYLVRFPAQSGLPGAKGRLREENLQLTSKAAQQLAATNQDARAVQLQHKNTIDNVNQEEHLSSCPGLVSVLTKYTLVVKKCPLCLICIYFIMLIVLVGGFWRAFELDEDFSTFVNADGQAMRDRQAYLRALQEQGDLEALAGGRRLASNRSLDERRERRLSADANFMQRSLTLYYVAKDGDALSERALKDQRDLELELRNNARWKVFCQEKVSIEEERVLCDPGESFAALAYPEQTSNSKPQYRFGVEFNSEGGDQFPMRAVFADMEYSWNIRRDKFRDLDRYFPKTFEWPSVLNSNEPIQRPFALRTKFTFLITFGSVSDSVSKRRADTEQVEKDYEQFIIEQIYPILLEAPNKYKHIDAYYTGHAIGSHEITSTLWSDIIWAVGSIIFVTAFMWVHMGSLILALGGFFIIFASVPMAYVATPVAKTTIASFLSLFLVTVIDIDVIFVFVDMWEQSSHMAQTEYRLVWMMLRAGKSTLATSLTTSLSFFANLASALQPLREFGLFMGLSVMSVYVLALLFIPPLVVLKERQAEEVIKRQVRARVVDISLGVEATLDVVPRGCCGKRDKNKPRLTNKLLAKLVDQISGCSCLVVILTVLCMPLFAWGIITQITVDTGIPDIFPSGTNPAEVQRVSADFGNVEALADYPFIHWNRRHEGSVCETHAMGIAMPTANRSENENCVLNWCQVKTTEETPPIDTGECWQGPTLKIREGQSEPQELPVGDVDTCRSVKVLVRVAIAGDNKPNDDSWRDIFSRMVTNVVPGITRFRKLNFSEASLNTQVPQAFEDWQAGETSMSALWQSEVRACNDQISGVENCPDVQSQEFEYLRDRSCEVHVVCSFGTQVCEPPATWNVTNGTVNMTYAAPTPSPSPQPAPTSDGEGRLLAALDGPEPFRDAAPRRLSGLPLGIGAPSIADNKRFDVTIVYGIRAARSTPLVGKWDEYWRFDPTFDASNPWAQRAMYSMCWNAVEHQDLYVMDPTTYQDEAYCWVFEFKKWLDREDEPFPSREFVSKFTRWYTNDAYAYDYIQRDVWMEDGKMKACKFSLHVDEDKNMPKAKALEYKKKWDDFVDKQNDEAHLTANAAYNTAQVWVSAEAEDAIVSSTMETIIIEIGCSWLGLLVFTGDLVLACLVVSLVIVNISGLAFFMTAIMHWPIGPIEVICLVIFVGFSVTYSLHIAHNFARIGDQDPKFREALEKGRRRQAKRRAGRQDALPEDLEESPPTALERRVARARVAMLRMGGAVLSSTVSTIGGSVFLLFCTLTIFLKLGAVIMAVTVLSVFYTMVSLPAVLILLGPSEDPWYKRVPRTLFRRLFGLGSQNSDGATEPLMPGEVVEVLH